MFSTRVTKKEKREIRSLTREGFSKTDIGRMMKKSFPTIKHHITDIKCPGKKRNISWGKASGIFEYNPSGRTFYNEDGQM